MIDTYYTPKYLAEKLVKSVRAKVVDSIADFCVGTGELLSAAESKWPQATFIGLDICTSTIKNVKSAHDTWRLSSGDFLDNKVQNRLFSSLASLKGIDLILINPPFTCKGGTKHKANLDGMDFSLSTSMKFFVESIKFMSQNGSIYAILPSSVAISERDQQIWNHLASYYSLSIVENSSRVRFGNGNPNVILVTLSRKSEDVKIEQFQDSKQTHDPTRYQVVRGRISTCDSKVFTSKGIPFIHTTNLINNGVVKSSRRVDKGKAKFNCPAVLLPRVGKPDMRKICLVKTHAPIALSDCVIAILADNTQDAIKLHELLLSNWPLVQGLYYGTGAPFITVKSIKQLLCELELSAEYVV